MSQILFPIFENVVVTPVHSARSVTLEELNSSALKAAGEYSVCTTPTEALALAEKMTPPDGEIVVCGSVFLVGELRALLLKEAGSQS
jgi:dihydrofolate synthase/folylpolyglutamate synthase